MWRAWYIRNQIAHNEPDHSISGLVQFLQSYNDLIISTKLEAPGDKGKEAHVGTGPRERRNIVRWMLPRPGRVKFNVDAAFFPSTGTAGVGVIARDDKGTVLLVACRVLFHCADAEEAELLACKEGLNLALQWCPHPVTVETDCKPVCSMLNSMVENRSRMAGLLREVKQLAEELKEVDFVHCYRSHVGK